MEVVVVVIGGQCCFSGNKGSFVGVGVAVSTGVMWRRAGGGRRRSDEIGCGGGSCLEGCRAAALKLLHPPGRVQLDVPRKTLNPALALPLIKQAA